MNQRQSGKLPRSSVSREQELLRDLEELRARFAEAEETLNAIRNGEVDAIVRSDDEGTRVYTLEGSDRPYRAIVETMNAGAVTVDGTGTIFYSNSRFSRMTGIPLENLIGSSLTDLIVPEDLPLFLDAMKRAAAAEGVDQDVRIVTAGGTCHVNLALSVQQGDTVEKTCIVITDISALKAAEESLRRAREGLEQRVEERTLELSREQEALRSEIFERVQAVAALKESQASLRTSRETLRLAIDSTDLGIWNYYPQTGRLDWSDNVKCQFGLSAAVPVDYNVFIAGIHEEDREKVLDFMRKSLTPGNEGKQYIEYRTKGIRDGRVRWIGMWVQPYFLPSGKPIRLIGATLELTERKRSEEALKMSEERFRSLFENSLDGVMLTAADGSALLAANQELCRILGMTEEEMTKAGRDGIAVMDETMKAAIEQRERTGHFRGEVFYRKKDGSHIPVEISSATFQDQEGRTLTSTIVRDITERRRTEEQLRKVHEELEHRVAERTEELSAAYDRLVMETREREALQEQLRQAQKMEAVGTLAGGIAHDFNNMLAVIMGNAEIAMDSLEGDWGPAHNVGQIMKASKRARDLVKQILTFSRKTGTGKDPISLTPLIKETFRLLRGTIPTTIQMELKTDAGRDTVVADPTQVQQVLMNLATNASHAMQASGGALTVEVRDVILKAGELPDPEMAPGHYVRLSVADTGTGIDRKVLKRIFEPFFTTKEAGEGTGMGLAVVYGIAKGHGGAVTVDTRPGKGSTFSVFLPLHEVETKEKHAARAHAPRGKERILVVDDEPDVVDAVSLTLEHLGYEVTTARSGPEAWAIFQKEPAALDLVLTDQTMPNLTGIDLAGKMLKERHDLPVILLTGYSQTVSREAARAAGVREYLMKPITKEEMAIAVRRVLDSRRG